MAEKYFQEALANFTYDIACGGAIRQMTDAGLSAREIVKRLDYPSPYDRVQREVTARMLDTGVLLDAPPLGGKGQKEKFTCEVDSYGRKSFRMVKEETEDGSVIDYVTTAFTGNASELDTLLAAKSRGNGGKCAYISCDFGKAHVMCEAERLLDERQLEYLDGILWGEARKYHLLNVRMREIVCRLYAGGAYSGEAYFTETGEHVVIR